MTEAERIQKLTELHLAMIRYDRCDPKRIQHFAKVHAYAALIGRAEGLSDDVLFTLETASYVHDIGLPPAEKKFGAGQAKAHHEEMGGPEARSLLTDLDFPSDVIDRAVWLVEHHQTYTDIRDLDHRILAEADLLVNVFEHDDMTVIRASETMKKQASAMRERIFRTKTGIEILDAMFGL